jgi:hypothetical protein
VVLVLVLPEVLLPLPPLPSSSGGPPGVGLPEPLELAESLAPLVLAWVAPAESVTPEVGAPVSLPIHGGTAVEVNGLLVPSSPGLPSPPHAITDAASTPITAVFKDMSRSSEVDAERVSGYSQI